MAEKKKLGEMLIEAGLIDNMQLDSALGQQRNWGGKLGSILVELGFITEEDLAGFIEKQLHYPCINISSLNIPKEVIDVVKEGVAKKYTVFPIDIEGNTVTLTMMDPTDLGVIDELQFVIGRRIKPALALESEIRRAIRKYYEGEDIELKQLRTRYKRAGMSNGSIEIKGRPDERLLKEKDFVMQKEPQKTEPEIEVEKKEKRKIPDRILIEALSTLLIEKGIIKREELLERIKKRLKN